MALDSGASLTGSDDKTSKDTPRIDSAGLSENINNSPERDSDSDSNSNESYSEFGITSVVDQGADEVDTAAPTYEGAVEDWASADTGDFKPGEESRALISEIGANESFLLDARLDVGLDRGTPTELPEMQLFDSAAANERSEAPPVEEAREAPELSQTEVDRRARELFKAVNRYDEGYVFGLIGSGDDPDLKTIRDILDPLNEADRKAVEEQFKRIPENTSGTLLRDNLQDKLEVDDWREMEAILNRDDGRTNDAGALMLSLEHIDDDRGDAERRVMEVFATLDTSRMEKLEEDFKEDYGISIDDALKKYKVSDDGMKAIGFLRKPADQRSEADIKEFAQYAVQEENLDYLLVALRGDSPQAKAARDSLKADPEFTAKLVDAFKPETGFWAGVKNAGDFALGPLDEIVGGAINGDLSFGKFLGGLSVVEGFSATKEAIDAQDDAMRLMIAMDALNEGRISLSTIALNNTGSIFGWFDNTENIDLAVDSATDQERQAFTLGHSLHEAGKEPGTQEEKDALAYYERVNKAFEDAGDDRESLNWEAKMLFGKDSLLAKVTGEEKTHGRFEELEGLSEADWNKLRSEGGDEYREQIQKSLEELAGEDEARRFMELLDGKVNKDDSEWTFEKSKGVHRTLFETIEQNKKTGFFSWGYREGGVLEGFERMSPEEARRYKEEPRFREMVDEFADDTLNGTRKAYVERLLTQVAETGKPPELGPAEKVLKSRIDNLPGEEAVTAVEALLADEQVRERLSRPHSELSQADRQLKIAVNGIVDSAYREQYGEDPAMTAATYGQGIYIPQENSAWNQRRKAFQKSIYEDGTLSASEKAQLGLKNNKFYEQAANLSVEERTELNQHLSEAERKLVDAIASNAKDGDEAKMTLADRIYASTVLDKGEGAEQFEDELIQLRQTPEGYAALQAMREEYGQKYERNLDTDFLGDINEDDRGRFRDLITPSVVDYRQSHYEQFARAMESESGVSVDATELTMERSLTIQADMLENLQRMFEHPEDYPPEDQEKLREANRLFTKAIEDYRESKEAFAEGIYQAAVLVGGLSVAVATGGVAAGPLLAVALTSAAGRIALKRSIQGTDYQLNSENLLKDALIGAATGGFSVLGPETIAAFRGVGTAAWGKVGSTMATRGLNVTLKEGAETIAQKELTNLIGGSVSGRVTREAIEGLASRLVTNADDAARLAPVLQEVVEQSGREVTERILARSFPELVREHGLWGGVRAMGGELKAAAPEIAAKLPGMTKGLVREASVNALLGGTSNTLIEGSVSLANDGQLDISKLGESFLIGVGAGATLTVAFKGAITLGKPVMDIAGNVARGQFDNVDGFAAQFVKGADGRIKVSAPEGSAPFHAEVKLASGETRVIKIGAEAVDLPEGAVSMGLPGGQMTDVHAQVATADGVGGNVYEMHPANNDGIAERSAGPSDLTTNEAVNRPQELSMREVTRNFSRRVMDALGLSTRADNLDFRYVNGTPVEAERVYSLGREADIRWSGSSDEISRKHAYYYVDNKGTAHIQDAGSTNGTYVNGKRIKDGEWVAINPTDKVTLGSPELGHELFFRADHPQAAMKRAVDRMDLPEGVLLRPRDYAPENARAFRESVDQSNYFGTNNELSGRIRDGYVDGGKGTAVGPDGRMITKPRRHMIAVDRANDPVLRHVIDDARARFGEMTPREKALALNTYVHELLGAPNMSGKALDDWHSQFGQDHLGEPVLLGEFIRQGKGVCIEQATLLKVLADELGLDAALVRGAGDVGSSSINHAWVHINLPGESEPLVFDPRWREGGVRYSQIDAHERGIEIVNHGREIPPEPHARNGGRVEVYENGAPVRVGDGLRLTNGSEMPIGRNHAGSVDRQSTHYKKVSSEHGKLIMRDGQLYFRDTSSNGTWVNGDRVKPGQEVPINLTDDIRLGSPQGARLSIAKESRPLEIGPGGAGGRLTEGGEIQIGRRHNGTVAGNHDNYIDVSKDHGVLSMRNGQLYFRDTSSNGTWINGKRVPSGQDIAISAADNVRLGGPDGPPLRFQEPEHTMLQTRIHQGPIDLDADSLIPEQGLKQINPDEMDAMIHRIKAGNERNLGSMPLKEQFGLKAQSQILDHMSTRLRELQSQGRIGPEWRVMETPYHSAADMAGADGFLVNTKTGEVHLLDPTGNAQKASNGRNHNVASLNEKGVVLGHNQIFDESGSLRFEAEPGETVRIDGEEVSLYDKVREFQDQVDDVLFDLSNSRSPLHFSDFDAALRTGEGSDDVANRLRELEATLRDRAREPEYAEFKEGLVGFADNIEGGALRHADRSGREVPVTEPLKDFITGQSDRVLIDHALDKLGARKLNNPRYNRESGVRLTKAEGDAIMKMEHGDGSIYDAGSMNDILKSSKIRLTQEKELTEMLTSKAYKGRMNALRAKFPGDTDEQIVRRVMRAIENTDTRYGLVLANRNADHPILTLRNRLANTDTWESRIEPPAPPQARVKPEVPVPEVTGHGFSSVDVELKIKQVWSEEVGGLVDDATDVHEYLSLIKEELEPSLTPADLARYDELIKAIKGGDQAALATVREILQ